MAILVVEKSLLPFKSLLLEAHKLNYYLYDESISYFQPDQF